MSYRELIRSGLWRLGLGTIGLAVFGWAMVHGEMPGWPIWVKSFAGAGAVILVCDGVRALGMASRKRKAKA